MNLSRLAMNRSASLALLLLVACTASTPDLQPALPDSMLQSKNSPPITGPGASPVRSVEQLHEYLCSAEWTWRDHSWTFASEGSYRHVTPAGEESGEWTTSTEGLVVHAEGADVPRTIPLAWLDGKFRIEIDGEQFLRDWDLIRNQPR